MFNVNIYSLLVINESSLNVQVCFMGTRGIFQIAITLLF